MLARLRKSTEDNKEGGFTLIELLVVMIIIGILAAIAIPAFLTQKTKAKEAAAKSDATNISKEIAAALVDGNIKSATLTGGNFGYTYTATGSTAATPVPYKLSTGNAILTFTGSVTSAAGGDVYCVTVKPDAGTNWSAGNAGVQKGDTCPA